MRLKSSAAFRGSSPLRRHVKPRQRRAQKRASSRYMQAEGRERMRWGEGRNGGGKEARASAGAR
eukprot:5029484-Pleurochrysis_carterae.AAC.1